VRLLAGPAAGRSLDSSGPAATSATKDGPSATRLNCESRCPLRALTNWWLQIHNGERSHDGLGGGAAAHVSTEAITSGLVAVNDRSYRKCAEEYVPGANGCPGRRTFDKTVSSKPLAFAADAAPMGIECRFGTQVLGWKAHLRCGGGDLLEG
jgi:hypothetical protein